ncbi:hypothetical protein L1987_24189 [Smallanthus sonchifolius]|uniref:Uncharacterized protein n=1 Tax=Smallanthus sonchifolius TaxID=185202 RepID=A0ACB9IL75_9ASTR|nr:hypothetical protein L1987_24189 [Smallanthus sonchifolius]
MALGYRGCTGLGGGANGINIWRIPWGIVHNGSGWDDLFERNQVGCLGDGLGGQCYFQEGENRTVHFAHDTPAQREIMAGYGSLKWGLFSECGVRMHGKEGLGPLYSHREEWGRVDTLRTHVTTLKRVERNKSIVGRGAGTGWTPDPGIHGLGLHQLSLVLGKLPHVWITQKVARLLNGPYHVNYGEVTNNSKTCKKVARPLNGPHQLYRRHVYFGNKWRKCWQKTKARHAKRHKSGRWIGQSNKHKKSNYHSKKEVSKQNETTAQSMRENSLPFLGRHPLFRPPSPPFPGHPLHLELFLAF